MRIYEIGNNLYEITHTAIDTFIQWNVNQPLDIEIDRSIVNALLTILVSEEQLDNFDVPVQVALFIQRKLFYSKFY